MYTFNYSIVGVLCMMTLPLCL